MHFKQRLSILFYLKRKKATKDGMIPIYVRITIDRLEAEISLGSKILAEQWDDANRLNATSLPASDINKKMTQTKTDLERHFDLVQAKQMIATPRLVLDSYKSPLNSDRIRQNKIENLRLSLDLNAILKEYFNWANKHKTTGQKLPIVPSGFGAIYSKHWQSVTQMTRFYPSHPQVPRKKSRKNVHFEGHNWTFLRRILTFFSLP